MKFDIDQHHTSWTLSTNLTDDDMTGGSTMKSHL